jgi:hypothetical protein
MFKNGRPKLVVCLVGSFVGVAALIAVLLTTKIVSVPLGLLMLVASLGLHLGFGILIAVYRLIGKLE